MGMFDFIGDLFGGGSNDSTTTQTNDIRQLPGYAESDAARGKWWDTLQSWGPDNNYGTIQPDWNSIWENARGKVSRYFNGGPEGPGLVGKLKASYARRGESEGPAYDTGMQRIGFQESNQLQDMAVQQAIEEARLGESGRKDWLSSIMNLSQQKPSFMNYGTTQETKYDQAGAGNSILGNVSSMTGISDLLGFGGEGGDIMSMISGLFDGGNPGDSGIGDVSGEDGEDGGFDFMKLIQTLGPMAMAMI